MVDPQETFAIGQVVTGRVTRVAEFGAFVELAPGIEGLAHVSTFAPTGRSQGRPAPLAAGTTGAFEILSIDLEKKRIGVALVPEGSSRADDTVREYAERQDAAPSEAFGSMADTLRRALNK